MNDNLDTARNILEKALEPLFASFAGDWEEQFSARFPMIRDIDSNKRGTGDDYATGYKNGHLAGAGLALSEGYRKSRDFIRAEKEKQKEAIKSLDIEKLIKLIREA